MPDFLLPDIRSAWYNGSAWTDAGGSATGNTATTGNITSGTVSSFGYFTFGSTSVMVPLNFLDISAYRKTDHNLVEWKTANEFSTDHYEVERSNDGKVFQKAATVRSSNVSGIQSYSFIDAASLSGTVWYRVRSIDKNGEYTLSRV